MHRAAQRPPIQLWRECLVYGTGLVEQTERPSEADFLVRCREYRLDPLGEADGIIAFAYFDVAVGIGHNCAP